MRRFVVAALFVLTLPSLVSAQTVVMEVDLRPFGATDAKPVDDDGDPSTRAWLLILDHAPFNPDNTPMRQLVVQRADGSVCAEDAFLVPNAGTTSIVTVERDGRRDVVKVAPTNWIISTPSGPWTVATSPFTIVSLDRVRCR